MEACEVIILQLFNRHPDKIIQVLGLHAVTGSFGHCLYRGPRPPAHDVTHDLGQFVAILEPETVRLAQ